MRRAATLAVTEITPFAPTLIKSIAVASSPAGAPPLWPVFAAGPGDIPASGGGPVGILLGMEDLDPVGTDLGVLPQLYAAGIRCAGLTYNDGNPLGGGLASNPDDGLTRLGQQAAPPVAK